MNIRPLIFASVLTLAACGSEEPASPGASGLETTISFSRGGGIAGMFYETRIEPDGAGVFDEREYVGPEVEPRDFEVTEAQLLEHAELAAETPFEEIGDATDPMCADCYVYTVSYGDQTLSVDQSTLEDGEPGAEAGPLVEALSELGPDPDAG